MARFLKQIDGGVLLLFLLVQSAHAQSRTHQIVCPNEASKKACDLFNEAVEDDDEDIYKASRRDHVLVCPRPNSNVFHVLSYDLPRVALWKDNNDGGVQQPGSVDFLRFINGNPNGGGESLFAVGIWSATSRAEQRGLRFQGTSLPPPGSAQIPHADYEKGGVAIDSSRVSVSISYFDPKASDQPKLRKIEYQFVLTTSTNEFVETTRSEATSPISGSGQCVSYK